MTKEEEVILHYLRTFAGQRVEYCRMLNVLTDNITGYDRKRFPVHWAVKRAAWMKLMEAANRLVKSGAVIRHRTSRDTRRRPTVRINEAFVKNPFYRKHE